VRLFPLASGKYTLVDDAVYNALVSYGWKWRCNKRGYAVTNVQGKAEIRLHRWILESFYNIPLGGFCGDHENGDTLDNRKENLRVATESQNKQNSHRKGSDCSSRFKGVSQHKPSGKWEAYIKLDGKKKHLGLYSSELDAAKAYDIAAKELFQDYAQPNLQPLSQLNEYLRAELLKAEFLNNCKKLPG